jgi:hypothetical protein
MSGRILFRNRLDPDNASEVSSIAWTLQSQTTGWPGYNGYLELVYDGESQRTLLYGVPDGSSSIYSSNVYAYNALLNTFTDLGGNDSMANDCTDTAPTHPGNRHPYGQLAVDTLRNRLWLWAGVCSGTNRTDLWYLTLNSDPLLNTWTKVTPSTLPTPRNAASMVYSPDDDVIFLFGTDAGAQTHCNWVYCPSASRSAAQIAAGCAAAEDWTEVSVVGGAQPAGVQYPRLMYDTANDRVVCYGGMTGGGTVQNETWSYHIPSQTWTEKALSTTTPTLYTGPGSPATFAMVFVPSIGKFLYHQTHGTGSPRDWLYNPVADTWQVIDSTGSGPTVDTVAAFDPTQGRIVTFSRNAGSGEPDIWHGVVS